MIRLACFPLCIRTIFIIISKQYRYLIQYTTNQTERDQNSNGPQTNRMKTKHKTIFKSSLIVRTEKRNLKKFTAFTTTKKSSSITHQLKESVQFLFENNRHFKDLLGKYEMENLNQKPFGRINTIN